ncbi:exported hypothetical protein [Verrucomicrobia bacterium]|nr:exported hypothetical protein [Verrucomicrobiota bacterium]
MVKKRMRDPLLTAAAAPFIDNRLASGCVAFPLSEIIKETGLYVM